MYSGASAALSSRFRRFPFSGGQPRVVVALAAAIMFAVHLLSMYSGHHNESDRGAAESVTESMAPSGAEAAVDGVDVLTIDHPHGELECGEITQSRLGVAASVLVPALGCMWVVPRPEGLIRSQGPEELPRWTPHLVRELGVQRV